MRAALLSIFAVRLSWLLAVVASRRFLRVRCTGLGAAITLLGGAVLHAQDTEPLVRMEKQFNVYLHQGRFAEGEKLGLQMVEIALRDFGRTSVMYCGAVSDLAGLYANWGRFVAAEKYATEAVKTFEQTYGPDDKLLAEPLTNLGVCYQNVGRYSEAARLHYRALLLRSRGYGAESPEAAASLKNLAICYDLQGYFADAEPLFKRALAINIKNEGPKSRDIAMALGSLGLMYKRQGRTAEAKDYLERCLAMGEMIGDPKMRTEAISALGHLYVTIGQYDAAEKLFGESRENYIKVFGAGHPMVDTLTGMATLYEAQGKFDEAEKVYRTALAAHEKLNGAKSGFIVPILLELGSVYLKQNRAEAAEYFDRVLEIYKQQESSPNEWSKAHFLRAEAARVAGDKQRAAAEFADAIKAADQMRVQLSGGEHERGSSFGRVRDRYTTAAEFYFDTGDFPAGLDALERGRNRSLLEQMAGARVNLLDGLDPERARQLEQAERQAQTEVASLEQQLSNLQNQRNLSEEARARESEALLGKLAVARRRQVDAYAAIRTASPKFRQMAGQELKTIAIAELQAWLTKEGTLLLYYTAAPRGVRVLVIDGDRAENYELALTESQAKALKAAPGKLTTATLEALLTGNADGVIQKMSQPEGGDLSEQLNALWQALIPAEAQRRILSGELKHLTIIPDGPLVQLPFEALVTKRGEKIEYLLDSGAAVNYAPSATILWRLTHRESPATKSATTAVLTVGDPSYGAPGALAANGANARNASGQAARYGEYGGRLDRLPYSGNEASWVAEVYKKQGVSVTVLKREAATEPAVRASAAGKRVLHLACHGLVDQSYGNFFGALALTPGGAQQAGPASDGFLSLNEIYGLNLSYCELSILSACQSNYGPQQQGEGVWALSRGFLVAGSRRVVASNWLVDDEAAASLVSVFCANLAKQGSGGTQPDFGAALREAKQWTRNQAKWQSPYYWATFVLLGPD